MQLFFEIKKKWKKMWHFSGKQAMRERYCLNVDFKDNDRHFRNIV